MREKENIIENFNRRVRNNEIVAKRVYNINKPRIAPTFVRVQRLFNNLAVKDLIEFKSEFKLKAA